MYLLNHIIYLYPNVNKNMSVKWGEGVRWSVSLLIDATWMAMEVCRCTYYDTELHLWKPLAWGLIEIY